LRPLIAAEFVSDARARMPRVDWALFRFLLRPRRGGRRGFSVLFAVLFAVLLSVLRLLCRLRRRDTFAERGAVVQAQHDHDRGWLLGRERVLDGLRPLQRLIARLIADEPGILADVAGHADLLIIGVDFLEPVGEPIGHRVADDDHGAGRRVLELARRRRAVGLRGRRVAAWAAEERERKSVRWRRGPIRLITPAATEKLRLRAGRQRQDRRCHRGGDCQNPFSLHHRHQPKVCRKPQKSSPEPPACPPVRITTTRRGRAMTALLSPNNVNVKVAPCLSLSPSWFGAGARAANAENQRASPAKACRSADSRSSAAAGSGPFSTAVSASSNCSGVAMPTRIVPIAGCARANRVAASVRLAANPSSTSGWRRRARATSAS